MRSARCPPGSKTEPTSASPCRHSSAGLSLSTCPIVKAGRGATASLPPHQIQKRIMISPITTLENPGNSLRSRAILSKDGFTCNLLTLEPAVQTPINVADGAEACILFVIEGDVTVREGALSTILGK